MVCLQWASKLRAQEAILEEFFALHSPILLQRDTLRDGLDGMNLHNIIGESDDASTAVDRMSVLSR